MDNSNDSAEIIEGTSPQPVSKFLIDEESERLTRKLPISHVFLSSAYFYPTSKSLGENAIALNMVVDSKNFNISDYPFSFVGSNGTHSGRGLTVSQVNDIDKCRYSSVVARGNTLENLTKLELEFNGTKIEIPFKMARYSAPAPVIICISPQFVAEQWQIFLMHVHTVHRFGGHLHIYITSMINAFFDLMKTYENQGYLTMEMWMRMKFNEPGSQFFDPNENTEMRNQAGAFTDCLLQYKEAAEYIAFFDMDDILFPLTYPTYLEEFNAEWMKSQGTNALVYGRREHEFAKAEYLDEFNFHELVASLKTTFTRSGKIVVKPELHNSSWIKDEMDKRFKVSTPHIIHIHEPIQGENGTKEIWKTQFSVFNETIHQNDVIAIHDDIQRMKNNSIISKIGRNLPTRDFYYPIVSKCFKKQFDGRPLTECPNTEKCFLPQRKTIKCIHSDAEYISAPSTEPFTFHYFKNPFWSFDYGCYQ